MLKINAHKILRLAVITAAAVTFAPQLAWAVAPGSLTQLASPNSCIEAPIDSGECPTAASGLTGTGDVAVSPDGSNVYVIGSTDNAIAEFARNADGSLTSIGCIADSSGSNTCDSTTGTGLVSPVAIVVSPDGQNVYVAAKDSNGTGTIAEFVRNAGGTLSPISGHDCFAENVETAGNTSPCNDQGAWGIPQPTALAISPDGKTLYAVDRGGEDIAWFPRAADGSLSQPLAQDGCIEDSRLASTQCGATAAGIASVTGVAVSPDGNNVYTTGSNSDDGTIAEFARSEDGSLFQLASPNDCVQTPNDPSGESCGSTAIGLTDDPGLAISPDGANVYVASQFLGGPIAEFARGAGGGLTQLSAPHDCIEEGTSRGCGTTGSGIANGFELVVSPDGANVYAASTSGACNSGGGCSAIAEFIRNTDGSLTQLASPDRCIQEQNVSTTECPGNETGSGLGGAGIAVAPDGTTVYGTGSNDIAAFARTPVTHTLTVSASGTGTGTVSDGSGNIACPSQCSHPYPASTRMILTAAPSSGSTFAGWGGACSGTGSCQVTMSADTAVRATFTANATSPSPGAPTPVLTGEPTAITDGGAGFSGSVNPEGLATSVYFQYGLDKRYSQVGASGPDYTLQTPAQSVGSDFTVHGVGPITVAGLLPNALYHVRMVATNSAGTAVGQDVTFTTATAPAPGSPTIGQTVNVAPVSGLVLVLVQGHLVPLTQVKQLPFGEVIDSLHGTFQITTSVSGSGPVHDAAAKRKTETGQFGGAVVRLHQGTRGASRGLTTIMMVESAFKGAPSQAICNAAPAFDAYLVPSTAHAAAISSNVIQLLHASAHGRFTTSGRYSAATVRGTKWTITARCDGTLVHDITDSVVVTDFVRHKTIILHAGQSYLAPGPRRTHG